MLEFLQHTFMQQALLAGLLISIAVGIIGSLIVVTRKVFIAGGIAHSAYGGIGIAHFLGVAPIAGALIFSAAAALIMGVFEKRSKQRADTIIGIIWAVGMAIGIIFIDLTKGYAVDLMSFLFGSIIAISQTDLIVMIAVNIIILTIIILFYKDILAQSFDPEFSALMNKKSKILPYIILLLTALTVVIMIRLVGLILIIALLTIPASIAEHYTTKLKNMMIAAIFLSAIFISLGLILAYYFNITAGALIVIICGIAYIASLLVRRLQRPTFSQIKK